MYLNTHADVSLHERNRPFHLFDDRPLDGFHVQEMHGLRAFEPAAPNHRLRQELLGIAAEQKNSCHGQAVAGEESQLTQHLFDGRVNADIPLPFRPSHTQEAANSRRIDISQCCTFHWRLVPREATAAQVDVGGVLYPMLLDETCFVLAADFDRESWREDAAAVQETCRQSVFPCALERSRSGNGAHLWLFFEEAVPAVLARKLGAHLLTETMERRPEIGLRSYDRFFPNQDTLPKGQLGNLIALPLQKLPRDHGNSVFLDDSMVPHTDRGYSLRPS
jgi:hypothetical protein